MRWSPRTVENVKRPFNSHRRDVNIFSVRRVYHNTRVVKQKYSKKTPVIGLRCLPSRRPTLIIQKKNIGTVFK